jgi:hypothetical protein
MWKMRKYMLLIALMFLITSCNGGGFGGSDDEPEINKEIYKGTEGVILDFFDLLPNDALEKEELNFAVKIENKGVYPVTNAKLIITLEKGFIGVLNKGTHIFVQEDIELDGKDFFVDFDDFIVEEVAIKINDLDELSAYHDSFIFTNFCYDYHNTLYADVCIDTDPYNLNAIEKPCQGGETLNFGSGQGGPVTVERIETRMFVENDNVRPQFKIYLANRGQGTVIKKNTIDQVCNNVELGQEIYNTIELTALEFSKYNLNDFNCIPEELNLRRDQEFFVCTLKQGIPKTISTFKTPLQLELDYGYTESLTKEIKIMKGSTK